jgi:hypothetical protein
MLWKHPKSSLTFMQRKYIWHHIIHWKYEVKPKDKNALNIIIHFATTKNLQCGVRVSHIHIFNGKLRVVGSNKLSTSHSWWSSNLCQHFEWEFVQLQRVPQGRSQNLDPLNIYYNPNCNPSQGLWYDVNKGSFEDFLMLSKWQSSRK